jgi:predicted DNA-binding protein with PD1-like motif
MQTYAFRLQPDQDLKTSLNDYARTNQISAGVILTCVGSLNGATLRMADEKIMTFDSKFEIVSLIGTFSSDGGHFHISLSDENGNVIGGHLKEGCIVHTTAEIVIGKIENLTFTRIMDRNTGFKELEIRQQMTG